MAEDQSETVAATAPAAAPESPLPPVEDKRECVVKSLGYFRTRAAASFPLFWVKFGSLAVFIWLAAMMTGLKSQTFFFSSLLKP